MNKYLTILLWDIADTLTEIGWVIRKLLQIVALLIIWALCELVVWLRVPVLFEALVYVANRYFKK